MNSDEKGDEVVVKTGGSWRLPLLLFSILLFIFALDFLDKSSTVVGDSLKLEDLNVVRPGEDGKYVPTLMNFTADYCPPCRMLKPVIEGLERDYKGQMNVVVVDVEKNSELAGRSSVNTIPLLVFFDSKGREVSREEGFMTEDAILAKWRELGFAIEKSENNASD